MKNPSPASRRLAGGSRGSTQMADRCLDNSGRRSSCPPRPARGRSIPPRWGDDCWQLGSPHPKSEGDEPRILLPPGEVPERSEGDEPHILLPPGEVPERSEGDEGLMNSNGGFKEALTCLADARHFLSRREGNVSWQPPRGD